MYNVFFLKLLYKMKQPKQLIYTKDYYPQAPSWVKIAWCPDNIKSSLMMLPKILLSWEGFNSFIIF